MILGLKSKQRKISTVILVAVLAIFIFSLAANVQAETGIEKALKGLRQATTKAFSDTSGDGKTVPTGILSDIPSAIGKIVGVGLSLIGAVFLVLMIYGGLLWMTAGGNEAQVTKAKDLLTAAWIGLLIVLMAYAITSYIGSQLVK